MAWGLRVHAVTHRATLHEDNRMVSILASHRRRQPQHVTRLGSARHQFEACRGQMMAFIDNEMTVTRDQIRHLSLANETLYHCHINSSGGLAATATDSTNVIDIHRQKLPQAFDPLLQQFLPMNQNERVDSSV